VKERILSAQPGRMQIDMSPVAFQVDPQTDASRCAVGRFIFQDRDNQTRPPMATLVSGSPIRLRR